ncbi:MAG TPA: tetratricopeptide repeat protein [Chitinophagaceae bacterium]|nr:tetratricopeptide repeat protein [Chitinophagaceae bacterium]
MKKPQWITIGAALLLTAGIFVFGRTVPKKKALAAAGHSANDGHDHGTPVNAITIDTILQLAKKELTAEQVVRINTLENSITRGNVKDQQLHVYHQLARFWSDSAHIFEPYAWYNAEAARLENSEKKLTFAARLFLDNLQNDEVTARRQWKAMQAKDLFERSLKINPENDSAKVGLGACYIFGGISEMPMEGILKIREVVEKDSTNLYAQMMLVKGSLLSGQYDKAMSRLETINRIDPADIDALLLLAEVEERMGHKAKAISWYQQCLLVSKEPELRAAIEKRVAELKK